MSKSLGTGINPMDLIEKYGADATRFGIAFQIMGGQDMKFVEDNILMGKKFCNKIWNASRFVMQKTGNTALSINHPVEKNLTPADKRILGTLEKVVESTTKDIENYSFGKATHKLYDFFWHDFCDTYIEISKKQEDEKTKKILFYTLTTSLRLLHPFIPFITEEIYQQLPVKDKKVSLMIEKWPAVIK